MPEAVMQGWAKQFELLRRPVTIPSYTLMPKPTKVIPIDDMFIGDLPDNNKSEKNCHRQEGVPQFYCEEYYVHEQEACEEQCTICKFENRVK